MPDGRQASRSELLTRIADLGRERGSLSTRLASVDEELSDLRIRLEADRERRLEDVLEDRLPVEFHFTIVRSHPGVPPAPITAVSVGASSPDSHEYARLASYVGDPARASLTGLLAYLGLDLSVLEGG